MCNKCHVLLLLLLLLSQAEDFGEHHSVFAGRELRTTQSFVWCRCGSTKDVVPFKES